MIYAICLSIIAGDGGPALQTLVTNLRDNIVGRNQDPETGEFEYYVLQSNGIPAVVNGSEVRVIAFICYNQGISQNIMNRIDSLQQRASLVFQTCFNPPLTRAQIVARAKLEAGYAGASKIWTIKAGDNVVTTDNANLLLKFVSL